MRVCLQTGQTYCTTNSTLRQPVLLLIPHVTQIHNTTVWSPQLATGNSLGALMNNMLLYVSQVAYYTHFILGLYVIKLIYTVNHKKCDILFLTITLANLNRFL